MPKKPAAKKEKRASSECKAVIEIGSNALRLKVAQARKNKMEYVESITYDLNLGRDTFGTVTSGAALSGDGGRIQFDNLEKICGIIKNFLAAASGYGCEEIKIVATTAIREATNKEYILDQIKIKTALNVEVIDDAQEKLYIFKFMASLLNDALKKSTFLVYIGSGSMGLSYMTEGRIPYAQNIRTGSLRISEMFNELQEYSSEFHLVVEEYLNGFTDGLAENIPGPVKDFVASGQEISMIAELCGARDDGLFLYIPRENFTQMYEEIKHKSVDNIALDYRLPTDKAEVLLPAMAIFNRLMEITGANQIISPAILLSDALMYEMLYPKAFAELNKDFSKSTVLYARRVASRYGTPEFHYAKVERYALKIFDKMKKIHGMGQHEKLLLSTAAILHDVGKFINFKHHYRHSYNIITGLDILGLSNLDREIVACICYYHSTCLPSIHDEHYKSLSAQDRVLVSKLTAILRAADALVRGSGEKFDSIDVTVSDELVVTISTEQNIDLEQWAFNKKSDLFEEVFGLKARLRNKRPL
ncbi:MAG: HD domain-containing protein [Clostridiales bacterium]|nr:HD domain-containing protein [Clostridiales bacterium]